jgi:hypothetical protein
LSKVANFRVMLLRQRHDDISSIPSLFVIKQIQGNRAVRPEKWVPSKKGEAVRVGPKYRHLPGSTPSMRLWILSSFQVTSLF